MTQDDKKKPLAYKIYDYTKGNNDILDQRKGSYATNFKNKKNKKKTLILVALSNVLDMTRLNSQAIYVTNNAKEETDSFAL